MNWYKQKNHWSQFSQQVLESFWATIQKTSNFCRKAMFLSRTFCSSLVRVMSRCDAVGGIPVSLVWVKDGKQLSGENTQLYLSLPVCWRYVDMNATSVTIMLDWLSLLCGAVTESTAAASLIRTEALAVITLSSLSKVSYLFVSVLVLFLLFWCLVCVSNSDPKFHCTASRFLGSSGTSHRVLMSCRGQS